jgi:amino acid transporter
MTQHLILLIVSGAGILFLLLNGFGWFLQKIDEFENRPDRD